MSFSEKKLETEIEKLHMENLELRALNKYLLKNQEKLKQEKNKFYQLQNRTLRILRENISLWNIIKIYEKSTSHYQTIQTELLLKINNIDPDFDENTITDTIEDNTAELENEYGIVIDNKLKHMSLEELLMTFSSKK